MKGATKGAPAKENETVADEATTGPEEDPSKSEVAVLNAAHENATDVEAEEPGATEIANETRDEVKNLLKSVRYQ